MRRNQPPIFEFNRSFEETRKSASDFLILLEPEHGKIPGGLVECQCEGIREIALYFCDENSWDLCLNYAVTRENMVFLRKKIKSLGGVEVYSMSIKKDKMTAYDIDGWLSYVERYGF